ncbi:hypothetical protein Y1Q_0004363 [Alligator mississippiensis]|uniref:Uncharacterized protein n=1 Tax=Alligator mississippiensis TaxID=8496 RepID=A0A151MIL1_ALLMI|nr:hypothetical protein Y1Q_0004363 [Alligator mississippiensis]
MKPVVSKHSTNRSGTGRSPVEPKGANLSSSTHHTCISSDYRHPGSIIPSKAGQGPTAGQRHTWEKSLIVVGDGGVHWQHKRECKATIRGWLTITLLGVSLG